MFSNRNLEEVHIELPPGFDEERKNGKVRRLRKSHYMAKKQSPRALVKMISIITFTKSLKKQIKIIQIFNKKTPFLTIFKSLPFWKSLKTLFLETLPNYQF